jgi:hypothetical protein
LDARVDSVVALRTFVDAMQDLDDIRPILPHLLDELFRLMSEVRSHYPSSSCLKSCAFSRFVL